MEHAESRKLHYKYAIDKLLADMQASYDNGGIGKVLGEYQLRLDKLASTYQDDESLGRLRYKLYEAQAYIHYLSGDNTRAEQFLGEAENMYGGRFKSAVELENLITGAGSAQLEPATPDGDIAQRFAKSGLAMFIVGFPLLLIGNNLGGFFGTLLGLIGDLSMLYGIVTGVRKGLKRTHQPIQWPIVGFAVGAAIILSAGYWLVVHPYFVRQDCNQEAIHYAITYQTVYDVCTRDAGL